MKFPRYVYSVFVAMMVTLSTGTYVEASYHEKSAAAATMTEGEVKKVNKDAGKITIKHGPLSNLDMPAMTMVFRVQDPAMLDQLKEGDQIRFVADKIGGQYTVTQIEKR